MNALKELLHSVTNQDWNAIHKNELLFVRSQDHIALHDSGAPGRILTAFELAHYYPDKLEEIFANGVASLPCNKTEPANTIKKARESLGITQQEFAHLSKIPLERIEDAENSATRTPIRYLQEISQLLDIDDTQLSITPAKADYALEYRLRTFNEDKTINKKDIIAFSEAAWIAKTQLKFEKWLGIKTAYSLDQFVKDPFYGDKERPAWKVGYDLAEKTREILEIQQDEVFIRETCEKLGIPVIQSELSENIAGATICADEVRAIIVANDRRHDDVLLRRVTIAHELGHLLWDTQEKLNCIHIDNFDNFDENPQLANVQNDEKYVERRANAFAVHYIAPICETSTIEGNDEQSKLVNFIEKFGISVTSATHHLNNRRRMNFSAVRIHGEDLDRGSWEGKESYGIDLFPLPEVPISRRGLFAYRVAQCFTQKMIAESTAADYLQCSTGRFLSNVDKILDMFEDHRK